LIGYVNAADAEQAIRAAIAEYDITNPHEQAWPAWGHEAAGRQRRPSGHSGP